jgi:hypothetical protein
LSLDRRVAAGILVGLVVSLAVLASTFRSDRRFVVRCGVFPETESLFVNRLDLHQLHGYSDLRLVLERVEGDRATTPGDRASARRVRLQCGLLLFQQEIPEAAALQTVTSGIALDETTARVLFGAAYRATRNGTPVPAVSVRDRFDVLSLYELSLQFSALQPPDEFDRRHDIVELVIARLRAFRLKLGVVG